MMKQNILNFTLEELSDFLVVNKFKKFNAIQIFQWIYKKRVDSFNEMTNLSKTLISFLNENFEFYTLNVKKFQLDPVDETTKFLFELSDGNLIETVLMKFDYGLSVCVTTQVGCNMGCKFCASGLLKKKRNLFAYEIVSQIYSVQKYLDTRNKQERISNIVVMGIGEPFDNLDEVIKFIRIVNNDNGLQIGWRKITVSTCGLVNKFEEWQTKMPQVGLAISLHAPTNEIRNKIMPINRAFNLEKLMDAVKKYIAVTNRRITFEYIMLADINDSIECAKELVQLLNNVLCYVNLIPYNSVKENEFKRSKKVKEFANYLTNHHIQVTIRQEKGRNIDAACGQLRAKNVEVKDV
ncbi:MAG: 23S rRNA (adenine(2503)-C(2))-methyltransferase RlmN [Ureaplasma sp.]|nr:23S rRNA (adenine(2503)-C(2))-methyltransferase RlmN [Ureaplasma sp.]MDE7221740.1 23S rRNA (adenine(2503)-C(2))-methyltransferase RlmN [Ureaplasma sp.]